MLVAYVRRTEFGRVERRWYSIGGRGLTTGGWRQLDLTHADTHRFTAEGASEVSRSFSLSELTQGVIEVTR